MNIKVTAEGQISSMTLTAMENGLNTIINGAGITIDDNEGSLNPVIITKTNIESGKWGIKLRFRGSLNDGTNANDARDTLQTALGNAIDNMIFNYTTQYDFIEE